MALGAEESQLHDGKWQNLLREVAMSNVAEIWKVT